MASQRSRRVTLPGAAELFFRSTTASPSTPPEPAPPATPPRPATAPEADVPQERGHRPRQQRQRRAPLPSGRQRHDEKITVYISAAELLALEQTR